jgi:phage tail-like protein
MKLISLFGFCLLCVNAPALVLAAEGTADPSVPVGFGIIQPDGTQQIFTECSGMGSRSNILEYRAGTSTFTRKIPGRTAALNVVCRRGITSSLDLRDWRKLVEDGKFADARRDVDVVLFDQTFTAIARWRLHNAWPARLSVVGRDAVNTNVGEEIELAVDEADRLN